MKIKTALLFFVFWAVGISGILSLGLLAVGIWFMAFATVMAVVLYSLRAGPPARGFVWWEPSSCWAHPCRSPIATCALPAAIRPAELRRPSAKSTLRADFSGDPVVSVFGDVVGALGLELRDLLITAGDNPTGNGGGLRITGLGQVDLVAVDVDGNLADFGGGIFVQALLGGPLSVNLLGGTRIGIDGGDGNSAESGGGAYCWSARMRLGQADIMSNTASGLGGGLFSDTCEVFSTDAEGDLRIESNQARKWCGYLRFGSLATNSACATATAHQHQSQRGRVGRSTASRRRRVAGGHRHAL